jgi:hypothetical protein
MTFAEWIKANPPPSLERLAKHYGGLGCVPAGVLDTFEAARAEWQMRARFRHVDPPTSEPAPAPLPESIPGADIPPEIMKAIEENCRARGIGQSKKQKKGTCDGGGIQD